jgi:WD40 repeat protein
VVVKRFTDQFVIVPLDGSPPRIHQLRGSPILAPVSLDPSGERVAVTYVKRGDPGTGSIHVVDLATGAEQVLRASTTTGACADVVALYGAADSPIWLPDGHLASAGGTGLRVWNLAARTSRQLRPCSQDYPDPGGMTPTPDSSAIVRIERVGPTGDQTRLSIVDLKTGSSREIPSHGARITGVAVDPTGTTLVTAGADGLVRVGPLTGADPHLLYGHTRAVTSVAVSPDGKWIASGSDDETIRLWPMPEGSPLHTLPYSELLAKLRSLTNLRVRPDASTATGYKFEPGRLPNWAKAPVW